MVEEEPIVEEKAPTIDDIFGKFGDETTAKVIAPEESYNDVFDEIETEPDIFGERYRDIEKQIADLDNLDDIDDMVNAKVEALKASSASKKADKKKNVQEAEELEDFDELAEDMPYEDDEDIPYEEESIFEDIGNEDYEELNLKKSAKATTKKKSTKKTTKTKTSTQKKAGILKNIIKMNAKDGKKATAN